MPVGVFQNCDSVSHIMSSAGQRVYFRVLQSGGAAEGEGGEGGLHVFMKRLPFRQPRSCGLVEKKKGKKSTERKRPPEANRGKTCHSDAVRAGQKPCRLNSDHGNGYLLCDNTLVSAHMTKDKVRRRFRAIMINSACAFVLFVVQCIDLQLSAECSSVRSGREDEI